jgi:hypothetical protein
MQIDLVRAMPPSKRIAMACEMYMAMRELILRSMSRTSLSKKDRAFPPIVRRGITR